MEMTILGSGGCMVIPKPLCRCRICEEARGKGVPYERTGPSAFLHDEHILIDTPAEVAHQINRSRISRIDSLIFTHLDPDHVEGFRVVEQIALDFRSWRAYDNFQVNLILPEQLNERLKHIQSAYGPVINFYEEQGFVKRYLFRNSTKIGKTTITAIPVDRESQLAFVYVFEKEQRRVVYASCDIKPFPTDNKKVQKPDLLIIQPGIFETGLKHGFTYPEDHISRTTLYTFEETLNVAERIQARKVLFVHLEEYWNRGYGDYCALQKNFDGIQFAYDNMRITI